MDIAQLFDQLYTPDPEDPDAEIFEHKMQIELVFSALILMMVTADIAVFIVCRVYRNFSSTFLLGSTIILMLFRLLGYAFRLFSKNFTIWERTEVDLPGYIFGIISIVLLFQWVQTYKVLSDPVRAMNNTMSSNTSFYC